MCACNLSVRLTVISKTQAPVTVRMYKQVEMVNDVDDSAPKKRKTLSDLESSLASSGPHEAVALLATSFPPVGGHWALFGWTW